MVAAASGRNLSLPLQQEQKTRLANDALWREKKLNLNEEVRRQKGGAGGGNRINREGEQRRDEGDEGSSGGTEYQVEGCTRERKVRLLLLLLLLPKQVASSWIQDEGGKKEGEGGGGGGLTTVGVVELQGMVGVQCLIKDTRNDEDGTRKGAEWEIGEGNAGGTE